MAWSLTSFIARPFWRFGIPPVSVYRHPIGRIEKARPHEWILNRLCPRYHDQFTKPNKSVRNKRGQASRRACPGGDEPGRSLILSERSKKAQHLTAAIV